MITNNNELSSAIEAARKAGEILEQNFGHKFRIIRKSPREMVSVVDMQAQKAILEILEYRFPRYGFITEERSAHADTSGKNWIIDPLDGTHNYIAGLPFSGISIGLTNQQEFELGVIFFPMEDRLYYAVKGRGAFFNHQPIKVSPSSELARAIVSFDNQFHLNERSFDYFKKLTERAFTTRILGTATNDLCLTAEGKLGGRIWVNTKICDIAAGMVIVTEAGGKVTDFNGDSCTMESRQVIASNGKIHDELLEIVKNDNGE
ncbi:MAG: inositol monophosphatase family protein [Candidatus Omnitrophota bacterium]